MLAVIALAALLAIPALPTLVLEDAPCDLRYIPDAYRCARCVAFGPGPCFALPPLPPISPSPPEEHA